MQYVVGRLALRIRQTVPSGYDQPLLLKLPPFLWHQTLHASSAKQHKYVVTVYS